MGGFVSAWFALLASVVAAPEVARSGGELRHVKEVYLANRSSIGFGTFRFDFLTGRAASATEARNGRIERASKGRGFYSFDGTNARYERLYEKEELIGQAQKLGDGQIRSSLMSSRALTDGHVTLMDTIDPTADLTGVAHTSQIYESNVHFFRDLFFPLNLGNPEPRTQDLALVIDAIESGEFQLLAFEPEAKLDGRDVAHIAFKTKLARCDYWIDLQRGGVPLQYVARIDKRGNTIQVNHDDIHDVRGSWLPYKLTLHMDDSGFVNQVVIHEAELEKPPARDVFSLQFDKPVAMVDTARNLWYSPRSSWSLLSLPSASSRESKRITVTGFTPPAPPRMPGERTGWPIASTLLYALGAVFAIVVLWRVLGQTRRRLGRWNAS